jgi:hypothetical protein
MGATPAEADAILGRMPEAAEMTNYYNPTTGDNKAFATHPGGNWVEAGKAQGAQQPKDTSGGANGGTGTEGAQFVAVETLRAKIASMESGAARDKLQGSLERMERAFNMQDKSGLNEKDKWNLFESLFKTKHGWKAPNVEGKMKVIKNPQQAFKEWLRSSGRFNGNGMEEVFPSGVTQAPPTQADADAPVKITTKAEWEALEVGTVFIDGTGETKTKE